MDDVGILIALPFVGHRGEQACEAAEVYGLVLRVQGFWFRVQGSGFRVCGFVDQT